MKRAKKGLTASEKQKASATQLGNSNPIFVKGDPVHYHPVIGGPHDGITYIIRGIGSLPGNREVAWLMGKAGCVDLEALSHVNQTEVGPAPVLVGEGNDGKPTAVKMMKHMLGETEREPRIQPENGEASCEVK